MISDSSIEEVKRVTKITEVIGDFVKLKRKGAEMEGLCPFHNEKTPSFKVNEKKGIYKCFGCGQSGDAIKFIVEHEKMTFIDAIIHLAKKYNVALEESDRKEFIKPEKRVEKLGAKALTWFEDNRKISNNTLLRFNITESVEYMVELQAKATVICFNYYIGEDLVNIKFRGPKKSFQLCKDAKLIFYNLNAIKGQEEAIIVEGEIDCLSMYEAGVYNCTSVPNGASKGTQKLEYLNNCFEDFIKMEKVILAVDNDGPGTMLREELARRIGKDKCWVVEYPEDCKDANEVLVKHGKEVLKKVVENAQPFPLDGIASLNDADVEQEVDDIFENGYPAGLKAHIPEFDELLSFLPGQLTIWTGTPGSGKSEFVDYVMCNLSKYHAIDWGVCGFESPIPVHITKLAEKFTDKSFDFRKNPDHRLSQSDYDYAKKMIKKHFKFIKADQTDITMDGLIQKAEELVLRYGIKGLLFDPWNCIEHKYGEESETKYILSCLNKLIIFLEKYDVIGFLIAHPTKMKKDAKTGKHGVPNLYDISGSAHFFNRTHNGVTVDRDKSNNTTAVYVQKVKWAWLGHLGFCVFHFDTFTRRYCITDTDQAAPAIEKNKKKENKIPELPLEGNWKKLPNNYLEPEKAETEDAPF